MSAPRPILLGIVGRPHGVRGHVRVHSYAATPEDLTAYGPLHDGAGRSFTLRWVGTGLAELSEIREGRAITLATRDEAARLTNTRLFIDRTALPAPAPDEFYLADLIGLTARTPDGVSIGQVRSVHDYGAGAFLEIEGNEAGPVLIPFTQAAVPQIDPAGGYVIVDPPLELIDETIDPDQASA